MDGFSAAFLLFLQSMENTYNTITLSNGLRVMHKKMASPVVYCGFSIDTGTRDESPGQEGLAHFCEHMAFKGTEKRSSLQIIDYLESVGGELNAYTTKEDTVFYAAVLRQWLPRAVDLLSDIVFHSVHPQKEITKEVEVICDEIESYNDTPYDLIYDKFENLLFAGHPLGHNILGTTERVRSFTTADAQFFTHRYYRPDNSVFFVSGNVEWEQVIDLLCQNLHTSVAKEQKTFTETRPLTTPKAHRTGLVEELRHTHQTHVMTGCRAFAANNSQRMPLFLLNNMLGGPGMNARLNLSLRERNGLVYTVESSMTCYGDTGVWCVYFGCDKNDYQQCLDLVRKELDKLMNEPLSKDILDAAKLQLKGQLGISSDNRENFTLDAAKTFLHYGKLRDMKQLFDKIDNITSEQIYEVANSLFNKQNLTTLVFK